MAVGSMSRTARIFLSSTFRDFGEERDLLVRKVFPGLRERLKDRFVGLVDVDLRWGITAEQAERGEVLPICLVEIDRSRPFFAGLLGERYGWIPPAEKYPAHVIAAQPWLEAHQGGKSVTELEILHGVLNDPKMAGRALFYFRSADYARKKGGDYVPASEEDARRQADLKERIRQSGFPVVEDYAGPEALAERLEADLWAVLDETFPAAEVPDAFERESLRHEAYAAPWRGLYLGGEAYVKALDEALASGKQWILIEGQSGGGKSALIANWVEKLERVHEDLILHVHYLGATADASDPVSLVRRLVEAIRRTVGSEEEAPGDPDKLLEALPLWLANASSWAGLRGKRFVFVIDALNGLTDRRHLRWFPSFLPERVQLVVSSLPGEVLDSLQQKAEWDRIAVKPLDRAKAEELFVAYLRRFNKELPKDLVSRIMDHDLVANPLFLRTLAEELRLFGVHEQLEDRLEHYLTSRTVDDLFERVLERVEEDNGADTVRKVMVGLWASRAGLTEEEIRAWADLKPAPWAYIRNALGNALLEGSGRIVFGHDYLRIAVSDRYLAGNNSLADEGQSPEAITQRQAAHAELARWFEAHAFQPEEAPGFRVSYARAAEEIPHQWREARDWQALKECLTQRDMFEAMVDSRGNQELLSYWLDIEANAAWRLEAEYDTAWKEWAPDQTAEATGDLASSIASFLQDAGRYQAPVVEELASLALKIETSIYGDESQYVGTRLNNLALLLKDKANYAEVEPLYRRALAIAEKTQGPDHPETGTRLGNLAVLLKDMCDYAGAEPLYRRALAIAEKAQGTEHPSTGTRLNNLALLLQDMGDYAGAEPLYRRALAIAEKTQGPDHPETGTRLGNLAVLLKDMGNYAGAEPLCRRALAISEKSQGLEHPETATRLGNLAVLLKDMGDYVGAEPLCRRALAISEKVQGLQHPDTGTRLNSLAGLLRAKGDYIAAEPMARRALAIAEKARGPEHPSTGTSLSNLARLLQDMGNYEAAEPLFLCALAIAEKAQGPDHNSTGTSLNNLASLLQDMGDYKGAEPLFRRALAISEKSQGPEHPSTGARLNNLAMLLQNIGNYEAAEPLYRRALAIAEKAQGLWHPNTGKCLDNLGGLLQSKGNYDAAEAMYRRALSIARKSLPIDHPTLTGCLFSLGNLLVERGQWEEGEALLREELTIIEGREGESSSSVAQSISNLAQLLQDRGEYEGAEPLFRRAISIEVATLGAENPDLATSYQNFGTFLRDAGKLSEAEEQLQKALALVRKNDGEGSLNEAFSLSALGQLYRLQGRLEDSEKMFLKCLEIRKAMLAPGDAKIRLIVERLAELYKQMGRAVEADGLLRQFPSFTSGVDGG
jgi:nephrocystin-3